MHGPNLSTILAAALLAAMPHRATAGAPPLPVPRVAATYSSWQTGNYHYRGAYDALFRGLNWSYVRVENTRVRAIIDDLPRLDIFCGTPLFNYDHAQPFEQYKTEWLAFLDRGGIILAPDCNYGQMQGWIGQLAPGLAIASGQCATGMSTGGQITITDPGNPWAPDPDTRVPWAHFTEVGPGWQVLARCPDGHPVCVMARIGKGVILATNAYTDVGYPTAAALERIRQAHFPGLVNAGVVAQFDPGVESVGANRATVRMAGPTPDGATLKLEIRAMGGAWTTHTAPVTGDGTASIDYGCPPGQFEKQFSIMVDERRLWRTTLPHSVPDLGARARGLMAGLRQAPGLAGHRAMTASARSLASQAGAVQVELARLERGQASAATRQRWAELGVRVAALADRVGRLVQRSTVAARAGHGGELPPFLVVRSIPLRKLLRDRAPAGPVRGPVAIDAARGEGESVQVALVPMGDGLAGVRVHAEPFVGPGGARLASDAVELYRVAYSHVPAPSPGATTETTWWPDPLIPAAAPFTVRQVCAPLWLDLFVPRNARPGLYRGGLVVEAAGHRERVPIELTVRPFALPAAHSLRQVWAFRSSVVGEKYGVSKGDGYKTGVPVGKLLGMADVCLKRRIGLAVFGCEGVGVALPYLKERKGPGGWTFDFTETDRIWQRVWDAGSRTIFCGIGAAGLSDPARHTETREYFEAYLRALQPHLEQKGWLDSAVYYMVDEPWSEPAILANVEIAEIMDRVAPRIKRLMTAPKDPRLMGKAQVWVPGNLPDAHPDSREDTDRLAQWKRLGPEMWWYICCGPVHPYPNFFLDYPGLDPRVVFWLTYKYDKTGFLYWGVEYQGDPREMTADGPTEKYPLGPPNGGNADGTLCYWGPGMRFYPSVRLNTIRDGIEDYEYLVMLRQQVQRVAEAGGHVEWLKRARAALSIDARVLRVGKGSPNFTYSLEPANLLRARRAIADLIEEGGRAQAR